MEVIIKKGPKTSYQSLFSQLNIIRSILSVVIYPLANFDTLKQRGFEVIRKITIDNLCKPIHDAIIIPFSTYSLNFKILDKKEENRKKLNIAKAKRSF